jgi:transposase
MPALAFCASAVASAMMSSSRDMGQFLSKPRRWADDAQNCSAIGIDPAEGLSGPRLVSSTARRHGISTSQLYAWRRAFRAELKVSDCAAGFVPARIVPECERPGPNEAGRASGRMEIVLGSGRRVIVDSGVDAAALARVIAMLEQR